MLRGPGGGVGFADAGAAAPAIPIEAPAARVALRTVLRSMNPPLTMGSFIRDSREEEMFHNA
ncbi:hypothetical protein Cs7R123_45620 [Catellatospora sp. TT07R-123]|nr:hypothetical protein Cs7R123_45620 [Catellatospora sp. TT07R-123]